MVHAQTVVRAVAHRLRDSGRLPRDTTYVAIEMDPRGEQSDVTLPAVELVMADLDRITTHNSDFARYETDDQGNYIGKVYRSNFEMDLHINCLAASGSSQDSKEMAQEVRGALARNDSRKWNERLPDPDSDGLLSGVYRFEVGGGQRTNDFTMTPSLRRTRTSVSCRFSDEFSTSEYGGPVDYIESVVPPSLDDSVKTS